ncbi:MAG: hypothetical protein QOG89_674 [Thermomicrobiales bacterium]|nr:hypothetical protein [Thermomicrobiales bacterium]
MPSQPRTYEHGVVDPRHRLDAERVVRLSAACDDESGHWTADITEVVKRPTLPDGLIPLEDWDNDGGSTQIFDSESEAFEYAESVVDRVLGKYGKPKRQ